MAERKPIPIRVAARRNEASRREILFSLVSVLVICALNYALSLSVIRLPL
jgi:hypothetical protein